MNKKIFRALLTITFTFILIATSIPINANAATFNELNEKCMFFKQKKSNTCTLAAAAMMVKRAARHNNNPNWSSISESSMKGTAWAPGLKNSFTYQGVKVKCVGGTSNLNKVWKKSLAEKEKLFKDLLAQHPEGIVMYCKKNSDINSGVHAVLLTDYTNGVFYCADPSSKAGSGRIKLSAATVKMQYAFKYWYVSGYKKTTTDTSVKINLTSYPTKIELGSKFSLKGTISSGSNITSIKSYIYDSNGAVVQSTSESPNKTSVNIANAVVNSKLKFGNLKAGNFTLKIVATNAAGKAQQISKAFSVTDSSSTLKIDLTSYPSSITAGNVFGLRGSISSNYKITSVKGYIINSSGTTVQTQSDTPNTTSADIKSLNVNQKLKFATLAVGKYTLKIVATDASGKSVTITKDFSVTQTASTLKIDLTTYPTEINYGKSFGLRGTISSNYKITSVKGYIINSSGTTVQTQSDAPNATSANIRYLNVNQNLKFAKLSKGTYTLKIVATDASGKSVTITKTFKVK